MITADQVIEGAQIAVVVLTLVLLVILEPEVKQFINWLTHAIFKPKRIEIVGKDGKKKVMASGFPFRLTDVSDEEE